MAGPHCQLQDWVLDQDAVRVDETGWRTSGDARALWTATTSEATFLQIAEHRNREQFQALTGPFPGIVISDRWNGFEHLDPHERQVCWSHIQRDFRRHAEGLAEQKAFGEQDLELTRRVLRRGAPTSMSTTTATSSRPRLCRSGPNYKSCSRMPLRRADAPAGTDGSPTTCSRSGPRSGRSSPSPASSKSADLPLRRSEVECFDLSGARRPREPCRESPGAGGGVRRTAEQPSQVDSSEIRLLRSFRCAPAQLLSSPLRYCPRPSPC